MTDTVIIIGAGVAGLAAGCYAQMNGYRSQIFELHDLPGLASFYHCGQWVEPGGMVPMAAISGRNVVQLLCRADGRTFTAHV
jgi:phytoene dehydrogenase-like protein